SVPGLFGDQCPPLDWTQIATSEDLAANRLTFDYYRPVGHLMIRLRAGDGGKSARLVAFCTRALLGGNTLTLLGDAEAVGQWAPVVDFFAGRQPTGRVVQTIEMAKEEFSDGALLLDADRHIRSVWIDQKQLD